MGGIHVTGLGLSETVEGHATPPAPRPGEHQWVCFVGYHLSDKDLDRPRGLLTADRIIVGPDIGCFVCEQPATPETRARPCPGEPAV